MAVDERQELQELRRLAELESRVSGSRMGGKGAQDLAAGAIGLSESILQLGSGVIAEPIAGLMGIGAQVVPGGKTGGQMVNDVRETMTYRPRTQAGQQMIPSMMEDAVSIIPESIKGVAGQAASEYSDLKNWTAENYGPAAAAALETLPTALLEAIPAGLAIRQTRKVSAPAPQQFAQTPQGQAAPVEVPIAQQQQTITQDLRSGKSERIAPAVSPDIQIMKDAEELGIDLNPSHYSTNRAYIDMEQSLKSRPGSILASQEEKAIRDLGNKADDLIEQYGGSLDKSALDDSLRTEFAATIGGLEQQSDALYKKVGERIPRAVRVDPDRTRSFIEQQLADLGGETNRMTSAEKDLWSLVKKRGESGEFEDINPTYAALDRVRKDIGSAIGSKSGPFRDDDVGQLKQLYAALSEDQTGFAKAFGVGDIYQDAKDLVRQRARLEDQAISLYGRELQGSILPKMRQAGSNLTRGDVAKLNQIMEAVPEARRGEVAATLLNDMFASGARRNAPIGQGFVNAFSGLNRNAAAKNALFSYLPEGAKDRFDQIGRIATGIYNSKALENNSKTARDVIAAMEDGGLFSRLYDVGKKVMVAEGATSAAGAPGMGTAGVIMGNVMNKTGSAAKAADELLTSPKFREAVMAHANGSNAQNALKNTPEYEKWLKAQNRTVAREVAAIGLIPWLINGHEAQTAPQDQQ